MEKQPGSKEQRAVETKKSQESGVENIRRAAESVSSAGTEIKKGMEILGAKNISPESKKSIRSKIDSLKHTAARLGAVLALSMPTTMLGHIAYVEANRPDTPSAESPMNEPEHEESSSPPSSENRNTGPLDPVDQLTQNMLLELATLLREHELGIDQTNPSELAQLTAETAIQNALEELGDTPDGHELSQRIRREITDACTEPSCNLTEALRAASSELARMANGQTRFVEADRNYELLRAESSLSGSRSDLVFAAHANRTDLFEDALNARLSSSASPEEAASLVHGALPPHELALHLGRLDPRIQAEMREALSAYESTLRDERATFIAAREAAEREVEALTHAREVDPFNVPEPSGEMTAADLDRELYRVDQEISRIHQTLNEMG